MKQLCLLAKPPVACGGSLNNTRHIKRTLSTKNPMHLVLKSKREILFKNKDKVGKLLMKQAKKFGIKSYGYSIQKDHIHFVLRIFNREDYIKFIRAFTGLLARLLGKGLFKFRPFTRIAHWGRDLQNLRNYLFQNDMEVYGVWDKSTRQIPAVWRF
jgi:REP element-mobilizing transposase RayT